MQAEPPACAHEYPAIFTHSAQGHDFAFLPEGADRYTALLGMIEDAERTLEMFYYMFQDDGAGRPVRDALVAAARRGVQVELIVDRFGTDADQEFFEPIVAAGGRFAFFNPRWNVRYLIRNHQKMTIADGKVALVGGFNISEHYFKPPEENGWSDLGVTITGPVVDELRNWFGQVSAWTHDPKAQYRAVRAMVREWDPGDAPVRMLVGGPTRIPSNWAWQAKDDLAKGNRLDLVMAYYSPPLSFRRTLRNLARRGKARLVMAAKSDNRSTIGAARATYGALLRAGAQVLEFQPCKLHMKLMVVDDITYFGSANFDHRSIRLNLELMIRVKDQDLADRMRCFVDHMAEASENITSSIHQRRGGLLRRFQWYFGWFLVSVLDYTVTRRLNLGR